MHTVAAASRFLVPLLCRTVSQQTRKGGKEPRDRSDGVGVCVRGRRVRTCSCGLACHSPCVRMARGLAAFTRSGSGSDAGAVTLGAGSGTFGYADANVVSAARRCRVVMPLSHPCAADVAASS